MSDPFRVWNIDLRTVRNDKGKRAEGYGPYHFLEVFALISPPQIWEFARTDYQPDLSVGRCHFGLEIPAMTLTAWTIFDSPGETPDRR